MGFNITKQVDVGGDGIFTRQLNAYLHEKANNFYPRERIIRPSEIHQCTRKILYNILGVPTGDSITEGQQKIFDNGTYVHKRYLKSYLPKLGCAATIDGKDFIEVSLHNTPLWLKGSPDAVIFSRETGLPYVFELKSIRQESFWKLSEAKAEHVQQVHLYMLLTGIPRSIVFYENKNTQATKEFLVPQNEYLMSSLKDKIALIQKYVAQYDMTKTLPTPDVNEDLCKHCIEFDTLEDCISMWKRKK